MSPIPRIARVPLTSKQPEACPHCGGRNLTRRGTRKKKLEIVQLWRCASCKRIFTPGPAALHNKTYPLRMILVGAHRLQPRLHARRDRRAPQEENATARVSPSTITRGSTSTSSTAPIAACAPTACARFPADQTIRSIKLYHRQVYGYAYHRPKLEFVRAGTLDDKRAGDTRFAALADFLESIPTTCPHDLFRRDDDPKARASQATPAWADVSRIIVNQQAERGDARRPPSSSRPSATTSCATRRCSGSCSPTTASRSRSRSRSGSTRPTSPRSSASTASSSRRAVGDGRARRSPATSISCRCATAAVHVLDYKPDARTNKPIAQLAIYALALTRRVPGLKLFDIKCAWFNEDEYCEIFPRTLFLRE